MKSFLLSTLLMSSVSMAQVPTLFCEVSYSFPGQATQHFQGSARLEQVILENENYFGYLSIKVSDSFEAQGASVWDPSTQKPVYVTASIKNNKKSIVAVNPETESDNAKVIMWQPGPDPMSFETVELKCSLK
jgi:hypothetical protein